MALRKGELHLGEIAFHGIPELVSRGVGMEDRLGEKGGVDEEEGDPPACGQGATV